ncbi:MAG: hypothetical protein CMN84_13160 [Spongiibacteraceae bacterium]|nr:hypothetical protein [Spongiibacteraceae bacterium]
MSQVVSLKSPGLYTHPNPLGSIPEGALVTAKNVVIDKEDIISNRRGFKLYGNAFTLTGDDKISSLYSYKETVLVHYGSKIAKDGGSGVWSDLDGTYSPPTGEQKIRSAQLLKNFYFTSSVGMKKADSLAADSITSMGVVKALGGTASITGSSGFLSQDQQVAYRIIWGIEDANKNLILGAPSERIIGTNPNSTGATRDISLVFNIPSGITTSHFYQVYRSGPSGGESIEPSDELQLVLEAYSPATSGTVTVTDNVDDTLRGATLYTSPSQEGIAQANEVPPLAKDVTLFKNHLFFGNTISKHRLYFTVVGVGGSSLDYFSVTGDPQMSGTTITNLSSTAGIAVGQMVEGTGVPAGSLITVVDSTTITIDGTVTTGGTGVALTIRDRISFSGTDYFANATEDASSQYFKADSSGTVAENIDKTARSLVSVVNTYTGNTSVYAYYLSGYTDLPGKILIEERTLGGSTFYGTSSKGAALSPVWSVSGTGDPSINDISPNRVYISKTSKPEAVPLLNFIDVGSSDQDILRIIPVRDSLFIFKEDGIYRISGETVANFSASIFDGTTRLLSKESAVPFSNSVYCFTNQGIVSVGSGGVVIVSRPIENDVLKLTSPNYTNFADVSFGIAYETDRKYIFCTIDGVTDTVADKAFCYNVLTQTWTTWAFNGRTCGIVNPVDDKLYLGSGDSSKKYIYQERKNFDIFDFAEEEFTVNIVSSSEKEIVLTSVASVSLGDSISQTSGSAIRKSKITAIDSDTETLTVNDVVGWSAGSATVYNPTSVEIKWVPIHGGNPGILKQFSEISMFFQTADFDTITLYFSTNLYQQQSSVDLSPYREGGWGSFGWGSIPWGSGTPSIQPIRTYIPMEAQRAHWLDMVVSHNQALTNFAVGGFSLILDGMSSRFVG